MKPGLKDLLWMAAGAALFGAIILVVLNAPHDQTPAARLALKDRKIEIVERMRVALASASEAEKSAVMATTDQESETFANQARAGLLTADELLGRYVTVVYSRTGSYEETARRLGLDRRTVKAKVDALLLARLRGAQTVAPG